MKSLREDIQNLVLRFSDNGHTGDPFFCAVRDAVTAPRKGKPASPIYLDFEAGVWRGITNEDFTRWADQYSMTGEEIFYQLRKMKGWCTTAGARGRKKDWPKFISRWLSNVPRYSREKQVANRR